MVGFRDSGSENGTRPSRFLADCNGVAADRMSRVESRESFREQGGGMRTDAGFRCLSVSTLDRLSPTLRLARAVEGINSGSGCVYKSHPGGSRFARARLRGPEVHHRSSDGSQRRAGTPVCPPQIRNLRGFVSFHFPQAIHCSHKLLRNTRKTGTVLSAPPEGLASSFIAWWRASVPFALL